MLQARRDTRLARDTEKAQQQLQRQRPELSPQQIQAEARAIAARRRDRRLVLQRACRDTRRGGNSISRQAGARFGRGNLLMGTGSSAVNFALANWEEIKNGSANDWAFRLGYEIVQSYIISKWGGRISSTQSSNLIVKSIHGGLLGTTTSTAEAGVFALFFGGDTRRAREHFLRLESSPTFAADIAKLEEYLATRSGMEEIMNGVVETGYRSLTSVLGGRNPRDISVADIQNMSREQLQDPEVMEGMIETIEDQLYADDLNGNTYGNRFIDRAAYGAQYSFSLMGAPRAATVGMLSYLAFCTNIDNPLAAYGAFGLIQGTNQLSAGYYYYQNRQQQIGQ